LRTISVKTVFSIFLIAAAGIAAYANSFAAPFIFDDYSNIVLNPVIKDLGNFTSSLAGYDYNPRRFIGYLTFALDYHFGGLDVTGYHMVNLAIHITNALLVYFLVMLTLRTPYFSDQHSAVSHQHSRESEGQISEDGVQSSRFKVQSPETEEGWQAGKPASLQAREYEEGQGFDYSGVFDHSLFTIHYSRFIALFSALLFVAHPLQTQAVTYIVQRFTSLGTMFYLLSLVLYIKGRLLQVKAEVKVEQKKSTLDPRSSSSVLVSTSTLTFFFLSLLFAVCAMKTKEITFTLPVIIVLYEFLFFHSSLKKKLVFLLPVLATLLIIPLGIVGTHSPLGEILSDLSERTRVQTNIPRVDYLLTQIRVVTTYIRLIFFPVNQNLDYDFPVSRSFFTPSVFLSFVFLSAVFGTAIYLLYRSRTSLQAFKPASDQPSAVSRQTEEGSSGHAADSYDSTTRQVDRATIHESSAPADPPVAGDSGVFDYSRFTIHYSRLLAFGIFWFFITLSVESSVIPIADVIFEHRVYLPSVGAFIALAAAFSLVYEKFRGRRYAVRIAVSAAVAIVIALSAATYARNTVWQDEAGLWQDVVAKSPGNARAYNNLGYLSLGRGRLDEAIRYFVAALKRNPSYAAVHTNLGVAYFGKGWIDRAIAQFQIAIRLASVAEDVADSHHNLGLAYVKKGMLAEAIAEFESALKADPGNAGIYSDMGVVYKRRGATDKAVECYKAAIAVKRDYAPAYYNLGMIYREQGLEGDAAAYLRRAHELDPSLF
jgi:Flp pilus assembly protein TadD